MLDVKSQFSRHSRLCGTRNLTTNLWLCESPNRTSYKPGYGFFSDVSFKSPYGSKYRSFTQHYALKMEKARKVKAVFPSNLQPYHQLKFRYLIVHSLFRVKVRIRLSKGVAWRKFACCPYATPRLSCCPCTTPLLPCCPCTTPKL